jgi:hypothetical protein
MTSSGIEPATFRTANRIVLYIKVENYHYINDEKKTPWLLVRKRTILTERPPLVGEVSANLCG